MNGRGLLLITKHVVIYIAHTVIKMNSPLPSYPCGNRSTRPLRWPHLASPVATNWSTIPCALFAKSPNCASHSTKVAGPESTEKPYSNPDYLHKVHTGKQLENE